MQGFNRYYPPNYDPKVNPTLNSISGKHALGDRARKLDKGILIVRFELPFNIWCGGCNNHIGQGVRYNAEKRKVGNYYSTPIFAFRCKCHRCDHWFEIRTDPQNTRYVITEGAKQRVEEWDPAEAGGIVLDQKDPEKPRDAMETAEKSAVDKQIAETSKQRIAALAELQEERWSDPYELSKRLRSRHRSEKKVLAARNEEDSKVKRALGLSDDLKLVEETDAFKREAKEAWQAARLTSSSSRPSSSSSSNRKAVSSTTTKAKDNLAMKLKQQTRQRSSGGIFGGSGSGNSSSSKRGSQVLDGITKPSQSRL